jgi:UDP-3-O-[3-hydroxymyristoyl] glucosamine N-acyltransferase
MHTTGSIAKHLGARLIGPDSISIERLDTIDLADARSMTFVRSAAFAGALASSKAGCAIVSEGVEVRGFDAASRALLYVPDADHALIRALALFAPSPEKPVPGVHPLAAVSAKARVDPTASIGPMCVVADGAEVGANAVLTSNVSVRSGGRVGAGTLLHPGVVIGERCKVGAGCILHSGVVIGADGFGFRPSEDGRGLAKVPHIGIVDVGDHVEIGANSCIDRAKFGATIVGAGTKIDNLVQIGHNCVIGRACVLCGQVGLAGSVVLGDGVILAARVGIADNIRVGDRARIGAGSGVTDDVPAGETWLGVPAMPARSMMRAYTAIKRLPEIVERVRELERLADRAPAVPPA